MPGGARPRPTSGDPPQPGHRKPTATTGLVRHLVYWREQMFTEGERALDAHRAGEYVHWFEAGLYDQSQTVQILAMQAAHTRRA